LARTLRIPPDLGAAAEVIVDRHIRRIDVAEVNGKPFFNVSSRGSSIGMTRELTHDVKQRWRKLGYAAATCRALSRIGPISAEIRHDGQLHKVRTLQISVGNGKHYGGDMAEEEAQIDDGRLDLYSLEFDQLWKLALIYPALRCGRHGMWKDVRTMSCTEVEIRTRRPRAVNTDGELSTHTPARFRVLPKAIVVLAARAAPTKPVQTD
jgi:diacylglycerol kinase (ATP)